MKIALVGNQNSGKTTLFNVLTGMNAKIGNWPGVTIEKKTGKIKGTNHEITDLPGIYSLSPYSTEEDVSRKFIFDEKPEVIINIIDSTSLERSLYLTTQLLELDSKVIIALNMTDILEKKGIQINIEKLEELLKVRVIKISALKEIGINELISELAKNTKKDNQYIYDSKIEETINEIENLLPEKTVHKRFLAVKLLEEDQRFKDYSTYEIKRICGNLIQNYDTDLEEVIATKRYEFIEKVKEKTVKKMPIKETVSDRLDKIFLNKWLAFPIFVIIMFLVYYLSVGVVGSFTVDWMTELVDKTGVLTEKLLKNMGTSEWVTSLVVNGIIAGVGAVLGFIPQLIILFI